MSFKRPHLCCDYDEAKLKFPLIGMPKLDGVRGLNVDGRLVGRSLKRFDNPFLGKTFDGDILNGLDGELAYGDWCSPSLCRDTTGFVNRQTPKPGKPIEGDIHWWIFDHLHGDLLDQPYHVRLDSAALAVSHIQSWAGFGHLLRVVPHLLLEDMEELEMYEGKCLDKGFEGLILRDPLGMHKDGRATVTKGAYMRVKRFIDVEGVVEELVEAMENQNEAKTNELGRTERSSHKENLAPKGMIGMLRMRLLADVEYRGKKLFEKGMLVDVGAGTMPHDERLYYFTHPEEILKKTGKLKLFPHGTKSKPRFPTWGGLRAGADMSE